MSAVGLLSLYTLVRARPRAMPNGVVVEKKKTSTDLIRRPYSACRMQPPRPIPSNIWWKHIAATSGRMVHTFCDAPMPRPITTECTTMPISRTCSI
uniref:Secreted protein n=1 Tax=Oryza rufipogon TaxID=4529 RepID=A0A0E0NZ95_ORYRU